MIKVVLELQGALSVVLEWLGRVDNDYLEKRYLSQSNTSQHDRHFLQLPLGHF